jgi:hypothetical protein
MKFAIVRNIADHKKNILIIVLMLIPTCFYFVIVNTLLPLVDSVRPELSVVVGQLMVMTSDELAT